MESEKEYIITEFKFKDEEMYKDYLKEKEMIEQNIDIKCPLHRGEKLSLFCFNEKSKKKIKI